MEAGLYASQFEPKHRPPWWLDGDAERLQQLFLMTSLDDTKNTPFLSSLPPPLVHFRGDDSFEGKVLRQLRNLALRRLAYLKPHLLVEQLSVGPPAELTKSALEYGSSEEKDLAAQILLKTSLAVLEHGAMETSDLLRPRVVLNLCRWLGLSDLPLMNRVLCAARALNARLVFSLPSLLSGIITSCLATVENRKGSPDTVFPLLDVCSSLGTLVSHIANQVSNVELDAEDLKLHFWAQRMFTLWTLLMEPVTIEWLPSMDKAKQAVSASVVMRPKDRQLASKLDVPVNRYLPSRSHYCYQFLQIILVWFQRRYDNNSSPNAVFDKWSEAVEGLLAEVALRPGARETLLALKPVLIQVTNNFDQSRLLRNVMEIPDKIEAALERAAPHNSVAAVSTAEMDALAQLNELCGAIPAGLTLLLLRAQTAVVETPPLPHCEVVSDSLLLETMELLVSDDLRSAALTLLPQWILRAVTYATLKAATPETAAEIAKGELSESCTPLPKQKAVASRQTTAAPSVMSAKDKAWVIGVAESFLDDEELVGDDDLAVLMKASRNDYDDDDMDGGYAMNVGFAESESEELPRRAAVPKAVSKAVPKAVPKAIPKAVPKAVPKASAKAKASAKVKPKKAKPSALDRQRKEANKGNVGNHQRRDRRDAKLAL
ncbi:MAG: uncharacterized protein KVP18_004531 [Porospora cf. gigantea A]|uniref:uncharacterized protein n=1 Tax=Porospora cf. gigantea A TaxID=2853593 RepID=UPI00355991BC|nr:MAG: hypothetical protein KVP18_004531 [Porospora cf. gigantea A]